MRYDLKKALYRQKLIGQSLRDFNKKGVIKQSEHDYRSGLSGKFFSDFDVKTLTSKSMLRTYKLYVNDIEYFIEHKNRNVELFAFLDKKKKATVGAIRFSSQLSNEFDVDQIIIRPWKELTSERIKFPDELKSIKNKRIIVITDHITTSGEITQAIDEIKKRGGIVLGVITHTIMGDFKDRIISEYPELKFHHIVPDDLPYNIRNNLKQKPKPSNDS